LDRKKFHPWQGTQGRMNTGRAGKKSPVYGRRRKQERGAFPNKVAGQLIGGGSKTAKESVPTESRQEAGPMEKKRKKRTVNLIPHREGVKAFAGRKQRTSEGVGGAGPQQEGKKTCRGVFTRLEKERDAGVRVKKGGETHRRSYTWGWTGTFTRKRQKE